jgi:hypothetical protein
MKWISAVCAELIISRAYTYTIDVWRYRPDYNKATWPHLTQPTTHLSSTWTSGHASKFPRRNAVTTLKPISQKQAAKNRSATLRLLQLQRGSCKVHCWCRPQPDHSFATKR